MPFSMPRLFVALLAAPVLLASSAALADTGAAACNLLASGTCGFQVTPATCTAECTPGSFVAECDGQCSVTADPTCVQGPCFTACQTDCTANPGSFSCSASCTQDCQNNCTNKCANVTNVSCPDDCMLDCENRCTVGCQAVAPTVSCDTQCQTACTESCTVQVNIGCHVDCTANVVLPSCTADCNGPKGAVFCGNPPQYIDLGKTATACADYLQTKGITASESCSTGTGGKGGTSCNATVSCAASPGLASNDRWGALGITGLMMGLGLAVSRRRRRR
jgi:hypothetical protein